jgi:general secretion pathway protein G
MRSKRKQQHRRIKQRGVTLIEIMIVLAIIGLVMGVLIGPKVVRSFNEAKLKTALLMSQNISGAYTRWTTENEGTACPEKIEDLGKFLDTAKTDFTDPWGHKYLMKCGDSAQGDVPFGVVSMGPDGKENTGDDIHSWDTKIKTQ